MATGSFCGLLFYFCRAPCLKRAMTFGRPGTGSALRSLIARLRILSHLASSDGYGRCGSRTVSR